MSTALILWGLIFGAVGFGFFLYGKKQKAIVPLVCGVGLMVAPYGVTNTFLLVALGVVLMAIPYFVKI